MIETENPGELKGLEVHGANGSRIGKVDTIYLDNHTGRPEWAAVSTGLFGSKVSLVPLAQAERTGDGVRVPYDKDHIRNAPHVEADHDLSEREEATLFEHFGVPYGGETVTAQVGHGADRADRAADDRPETTTDERHGDRLAGTGAGTHGGGEPVDEAVPVGGAPVGNAPDRAGGAPVGNAPDLAGGDVEHLEGGRLRLRRVVVTEYVPVSREVYVEGEPGAGAQAGTSEASSPEPGRDA